MLDSFEKPEEYKAHPAYWDIQNIKFVPTGEYRIPLKDEWYLGGGSEAYKEDLGLGKIRKIILKPKISEETSKTS